MFYTASWLAVLVLLLTMWSAELVGRSLLGLDTGRPVVLFARLALVEARATDAGR